MGRGNHLTHAQWVQVVVVAGVGTVLEWLDFYIYTQLNATLEKVFFPTKNEAIQAVSFWGVYAAAFVVRPLGALIFGHIGDTRGRNRCLLLSILCMAFATAAIGVLPTYDIGKYHAGIAAPILLALLRILQGLAMGGEFGSAVTYISELAPRGRRGVFVALLQMSVNVGMILATLLVMLLQNTLSEDAMLNWGWRIPFFCAFLTALLGAFLRRTMPEPHAFLTAARLAKLQSRLGEGGAAGAANGGPSIYDASVRDVDIEVATTDGAHSVKEAPIKDSNVKGASVIHQDADDVDDEYEVHSALAGAGHSNVRTPILRLLRNNALGLFLHICFMAWVSGAFYTTVSWLAKDLRTYKYPLIQTQGLLIVSLIPNAIGLLAVGHAIDRGVRATWSNAALVAVGIPLGFAVYKGVSFSLPTAWGLVCLFHLVIGGAMANVALPCTRIYEPLQRTTGFSFGYNFGYGVLGGLSPLAVAAIKASLPNAAAYAPALWLLVLGAISFVGIVGLSLYQPRLARPYVGRIE